MRPGAGRCLDGDVRPQLLAAGRRSPADQPGTEVVVNFPAQRAQHFGRLDGVYGAAAAKSDDDLRV